MKLQSYSMDYNEYQCEGITQEEHEDGFYKDDDGAWYLRSDVDVIIAERDKLLSERDNLLMRAYNLMESTKTNGAIGYEYFRAIEAWMKDFDRITGEGER